jgi:predicted dithiol-disulfide oxidoreductase (DUF899 family)
LAGRRPVINGEGAERRLEMPDVRFPNESAEYREARDRLLAGEVALRKNVEEVAALRRQLPLGGPVPEDYVFDEIDVDGRVTQVKLSELFTPGKDSLFLYGYMFGPDYEQPCPMCSSLLDGLEGNARHITQRINLAVAARSPIERLGEVAASRGWKNLRLLSSSGNSCHSDYFAEDAEGHQWPMANVFVKRDGAVYHFWGSELMFREYPGGDMRHMDMMWPLWNGSWCEVVPFAVLRGIGSDERENQTAPGTGRGP